MPTRLFLLAILFVLPNIAHPQASSAPMTHSDPMYLLSLQKWRTQHAEALTAPDSWLSLAALEWLKSGDTTVGSAPGNSLLLEPAPARLATFRLAGPTLRLVAPRGGFPKGTTLNGQPIKKSPEASISLDPNHPSELRNGGLLLLVIQRGDRLYLRVKDAASPARLAFHGLDWFHPDPQYRITAKWIPSGMAASLNVPNVLGQISHESSPGMAEFTLYGQVVRLFPILDSDDKQSLFFIFRDATSKTSTYAAGRFLYATLPSNGIGRSGTIVLDFNKAENPPCAYTPYATCPLPPEQNRLTIPIPAGERRYHE
jgi:uncharacterized protein